MVDPRLKPGTAVDALASRIMNKAECARQFGSLSRTQTVPGIVIEAVKRKNPQTDRTINKVIVDFDFGYGITRRKEVSLRVLEKYKRPTTPPVLGTFNLQDVMDQHRVEMELVIQNNNNNIDNLLQELNNGTNIDSTDTDSSRDDNDNNITNINFNDVLIDNNNPELDVTGTATAEIPATEAVNPTTTLPPTPDHRVTRHMASPLRVNVAATVHGEDWHDEPAQLHHELNGQHRHRSWEMVTTIGDVIRAGDNTDERYSRLDIFLMMFPPKELEIVEQLTTKRLEEDNLIKTTKGEIVRFFGTLILITRYEFTTRASLWSNHPPSKYETAPMFGKKTRFTRKRFNELMSHIRFSNQPNEKPDSLSSEQYRWLLVDGFIKEFNDYRRSHFRPSDVICVDESISRWYGQGGDWINHGLPMYIAIDRKPENGCEIQDACCGRSGVMLQLLLVKTKREQENTLVHEVNDNHGTAVLKKLVQGWAFSDRIVCADSYFASVNCCLALKNMGLKFVGVVKTATKKFPMGVLTSKRLHLRGDRYGLVHKNAETGRPDMIAFVWLDRERRYFISSGPCLVEGEPYRRFRWRQVEDVQTDNPPERVELIVQQPKASEVYYTVCGKVDNHNRDRQATLGLETKLRTNDWSMRVNLTVFGIIIVDTWRVWSLLSAADPQYDNEDGGNGGGEVQKIFYGHLAAEMIDNNIDRVGGKRRQTQSFYDDDEDFDPTRTNTTPRSGVGAHITPTKERTNRKSTHRKQGKCRVCGMKTTHCCSVCTDNGTDAGWICHSIHQRPCFNTHLRECHDIVDNNYS